MFCVKARKGGFLPPGLFSKPGFDGCKERVVVVSGCALSSVNTSELIQ